MGVVRAVAVPLAVLFALATGASAFAHGYKVRPGDTLWSISHQEGVSYAKLLRANSELTNANLSYPGETISVPDPPAPPAAAAPPAAPARPGLDREQAKALLAAAARHHGLRSSFVLALSYWESGWNQSVVSSSGAIGMMQITPGTAAYAGPWLLGRKVDIRKPADNTELGAALLRRYVDEFKDPKLALAAYYQGEAGTRKHGIYPSSQRYVDGIWALRNRFESNPP